MFRGWEDESSGREEGRMASKHRSLPVASFARALFKDNEFDEN